MFGRAYKLFSVYGITVRVDLSWLIIALLITWSLAVGLFPERFVGLPWITYWLMGVVGALGLFLSVILHELSHSLVARRYGIPIKGITLFIFGGVAEMQDEPESPKAEFLMAAAGPIMSLLISAVSWGLFHLSDRLLWPLPAIGIFWYLGLINVLLAAFNLIPGFPLDGGRLLRAILWHWNGNLRSATQTAARIGSLFGLLLIALGVFSFLTGSFVSGVWWVLIGMFLRNAAQRSYQQLLVRQSLQGMPVGRFMNPNVVTVQPDTTIEQLVEQYLYTHHYRIYPVVDSGRLVGCVSMRQIKLVPREQWHTATVGSIICSCGRDNTISPQTDAMEVLGLMSRSGSSRLMVVEGERLVGIVTLRDLMKFLAIKMELDGTDGQVQDVIDVDDTAGDEREQDFRR